MARSCTTQGSSWRLAMCLPLILLFVAACGSARSGRTGIEGSVRKWSDWGGTVPASHVLIECVTAASHKQVLAARTDDTGGFFLAVPAGRYLVTYASGGRPMWQQATVADGHVTRLEPFVGLMGSSQPPPDYASFERAIRPRARALGVRRITAKLGVTGATLGAAQKLFGTRLTLPADTHVWICVLTAKVGSVPRSKVARNLARGGFAAYELDASNMRCIATRSLPDKWQMSDWTNPDAWGGTLGFPLFGWK